MKNIQEAKTHLSRLVELAAEGEEIIIAKAGKPMAKLVPFTPRRAVRTGGFLAGKIRETAGCWEPDEALDGVHDKRIRFPIRESLQSCGGTCAVSNLT